MQHELILNFHGIGTPGSDISPGERTVWMDTLRFSSLLDAVVALQESELPPIVITFDDGNASDALIALPELSKRQLTATFFICAARIGAPGYLDKAAIKDLLDAGMKVGSHGMSHRDWRATDNTTLDEEVTAARRRIESACARKITEAAIPFGSYDRRVLDKLKAEKFDHVYTSDRGWARPGAWLKPRNTLGADARPDDVAELTVGAGIAARLLRDLRMSYKRLRT